MGGFIPARHETPRRYRLELGQQKTPAACGRIVTGGKQSFGAFIDLADIADREIASSGLDELIEMQVDPLISEIGHGRPGADVLAVAQLDRFELELHAVERNGRCRLRYADRYGRPPLENAGTFARHYFDVVVNGHNVSRQFDPCHGLPPPRAIVDERAPGA